MPNWCENRVELYSQDKEQINAIKEIFKKDQPFNTIMPEPDWNNTPNEDGELPVKTDTKDDEGNVVYTSMKFPKSGLPDDRWYYWNADNWGTKWDLKAEHVEMLAEDDPNSFEMYFDTAWAPPEGICDALREQYPDVEITWFYDEPGMQFAGYL